MLPACDSLALETEALPSVIRHCLQLYVTLCKKNLDTHLPDFHAVVGTRPIATSRDPDFAASAVEVD